MAGENLLHIKSANINFVLTKNDQGDINMDIDQEFGGYCHAPRMTKEDLKSLGESFVEYSNNFK